MVGEGEPDVYDVYVQGHVCGVCVFAAATAGSW